MKRFLFLILFLNFVFGSFGTNNVNPKNIIQKTEYGEIIGLNFETYRRFQGVPFATPPLGKLRWMPPIPASPWSTPINCTYFDIGCAQNAHSLDVPKNTSEDCLYLEVWAPPIGKYSEPSSVALFFYGGDFKEGGESFGIYNGRFMAETTNTIVIVPNYRVGNLGFLYLRDTGAVNAGLEDQRMAMKWVQNNIKFFGGDPSRVMIFGQSAGGESILIHMSAPKVSQGLFTRALVESGPMSLNFKLPNESDALADVFSINANCGTPAFQKISCLQSLTTKEVLKAADGIFIVPIDISESVMQFTPTLTFDEKFPQQPLDAFEKGEIMKVPFAIGSNKGDGVVFGYAISLDIPFYEYVAIVSGVFHNDDIPTVLEHYPPNLFGSNTNITAKFLNDYLFLCPSRYTAKLSAKTGNPTYYYQFTRIPPFCPWPKAQKFCCDHVCHGDEMAYVYHDSGSPFPWNFTNPIDINLSQSMSNYWASFAYYGDPNKLNKPGILQWPLYNESTDLNIDLNWPLSVVNGLDKKNCDMFDKVGYWH